MRKINRFFLAVIVLTVLIVSCEGWGMPKKIRVKAKPKVPVSAGKTTFELKKYITQKKISDMVKDVPGLKIYEYVPANGDPMMHLLAQYTISKQIAGLDIEKHMEGLTGSKPMSFGYEDDGTTPKVLFSIPTVSKQITKTIDFRKELNVKEKILFTDISLSIPELGSNHKETISQNVKWDQVKAESIVFDANSELQIPFTALSGASADFKAKITKIEIKNKTTGDSVAEYTSPSIDLKTGGTAGIDIANKEFPTNLDFFFTIAISGGSLGTTAVSSTKPVFSDETKIKKIIGLTDSETTAIPVSSIDLGSDVLKGATVGEGAIMITANVPGSWTGGINSKISLTVEQADAAPYLGLHVDKDVTGSPSITGPAGKIDLAGKTINANKIDVSGSVTFTMTNATIDFSTGETEITPTIDVNITKFSSLTVDTTGKVDASLLTQEFTYPLAEVKKWVNTITFADVGIDLALTNGLPKDISLKLTSKALGLTDKLYPFPRESAEKTENVRPTSQPHTLDFTNTSLNGADGKPYFDVKIEVEGIPSGGLLTLTDVTAGTDCTLCGKANPVLNWTTAKFQIPADFKLEGGYPEAGGNPLDLSKLKTFLGNDIKIRPIKLYGYAESKALQKVSGDLGISALVKAEYTGGPHYIVGSVSGGGETFKSLELKSKPNIAPQLNAEKTKFDGDIPEGYVFETEAFSEVVNMAPNDMELKYTVKVGGDTNEIPVNKADLDTIGGDIDINVTLLMDIPLAFDINGANGYAEIDLKKIIFKDQPSSPKKDLLGRSEASKLDGLSGNILSSVEYVKMQIDYNNNLGISPELVLEDGPGFKKTIKLQNGAHTAELMLTTDDAKYILETYPFSPEMKLQLPNTSAGNPQGIKRDAALQVSVIGEVKFDVNYSHSF